LYLAGNKRSINKRSINDYRYNKPRHLALDPRHLALDPNRDTTTCSGGFETSPNTVISPSEKFNWDSSSVSCEKFKWGIGSDSSSTSTNPDPFLPSKKLWHLTDIEKEIFLNELPHEKKNFFLWDNKISVQSHHIIPKSVWKNFFLSFSVDNLKKLLKLLCDDTELYVSLKKFYKDHFQNGSSFNFFYGDKQCIVFQSIIHPSIIHPSFFDFQFNVTDINLVSAQYFLIAYFSRHPNNLFFGPESIFRFDDPNNGLDFPEIRYSGQDNSFKDNEKLFKDLFAVCRDACKFSVDSIARNLLSFFYYQRLDPVWLLFEQPSLHRLTSQHCGKDRQIYQVQRDYVEYFQFKPIFLSPPKDAFTSPAYSEFNCLGKFSNISFFVRDGYLINKQGKISGFFSENIKTLYVKDVSQPLQLPRCVKPRFYDEEQIHEALCDCKE
tara:strand:- start:5797 stop:7107 length:1311 start_codon:yes stop_codon:yes gene_type:complete